jgi:hypothetical protein
MYVPRSSFQNKFLSETIIGRAPPIFYHIVFFDFFLHENAIHIEFRGALSNDVAMDWHDCLTLVEGMLSLEHLLPNVCWNTRERR